MNKRVIYLKVTIDSTIFEQLPTLKIGLIYYNKIIVSESPQMLKGRLQLFQEQLFFELDEKAVTDFAGVKEWRETWKRFGSNPSRYRPSNEALLRRIQKQNYLPSVHSAVDMNNFLSLQYDIPLGIYNTTLLQGDIQLQLGTVESTYEGLNGRINHLNNILTLTDEKGPFGSPYVDSKRTAVNEETTSALHVFFLKPSQQLEDAEQLLQAAGKMFTTIHGGDFQTALLSIENPSSMMNSKMIRAGE